jgi:hypothetical protein
MPAAGRDAVVRFVRGTLGCTCPDEVFDEIELETRSAPGLSLEALGADAVEQVLHVGGRLLIALCPTLDERRLQALLRAGVALRDARGYNRFRVAIAGSGPAPERVAELLGGLDDRVHVHVVDWPAALTPRAR